MQDGIHSEFVKSENAKQRTHPRDLARARELRQDQTRAEKLLWKLLRNRKLGGFKFCRQFPILGFFADFYCEEAKLVVELDGVTHEGQAVRDDAKDRSLTNIGLEVLRFSNFEVRRTCSDVPERILLACKRRTGGT